MPDGEYLLNKVKIKSDIEVDDDDALSAYLHQKPNNKVLGFWRMRLNLYNSSGSDTTKWGNRWLRRIGEPPVIYDSVQMEYSRQQLTQVLKNRGYMNAEVTATCKKLDRKGDKRKWRKKADVVYEIRGNEPYAIRHYLTTLPDTEAMMLLRQNEANKPQTGMLFNVDALNEERARITRRLRNRGYYNFQKELLQYTVDSTLGTHEMDVELALQPQYLENDSALKIIFTKRYISQITILAVKDVALVGRSQDIQFDTTVINGIKIINLKNDDVFRPKALCNKIRFSQGSLYSERQVEQTYTQLTKLAAVKYVNITFADNTPDSINAFILVAQEKPHTVSAEVEGTFSGGDFGAGLKIGYKNNNIFKGSEEFNISASGGYESMGRMDEVNSAWNIGGNASLRFPQLIMPSTKEFRRRAVGTSEVSVSMNFQRRPEYDRNIASAGWKYNWRWRRINFNYNFLDISYIYLPRKSQAFIDKYMRPTSSIRFSYEDHFIMRMGIGLNYTNRRDNQPLRNYHTIRASVVSSGNLLYGISSAIHQKKNSDGAYEIFKIRYAQFAKADIDYAYNCILSKRTKLVMHTGLGVAIPYGNTTILPFEERYYSGGSNSMRGWTARTLGPGNMAGSGHSIDFMNQSGDIKLDLNVEARFRIVWKLEAAIFSDAGNIWTIRNYPEQPTGQFLWNRFYKQIGWNYGFGARIDFSFLVIRLDLGIKLYDPGYADESSRWRTELSWRKDCALHFAVGYPF